MRKRGEDWKPQGWGIWKLVVRLTLNPGFKPIHDLMNTKPHYPHRCQVSLLTPVLKYFTIDLFIDSVVEQSIFARKFLSSLYFNLQTSASWASRPASQNNRCSYPFGYDHPFLRLDSNNS